MRRLISKRVAQASIVRIGARFVRLTPAQRRLVIESAALVVLMRVALWALPFRRVCAMANRLGGCGLAGAARSRTLGHRISADQLSAVVRAVSRYVPAATCLTQALAAQVVLQRRGYDAVLRLGVARHDNQLQAHAWIECDNRVVIGDNESFGRFTPLPPLEQQADIMGVPPAEGVVP